MTEPENPDAVPWALMAPGDQAVYMPCNRGDCPQEQPPEHYHLDHVMHQEA